jgi:polar amino acid transport system substrate-binding protein
MLHLTRRGAGLLVAALASILLTPSGRAASTDVPAPGQSPKIDAIKERGSLRVAAIGEFPWLPENTTGSGPQFSGPAWVLAEEYAERLGVPL